MIAMNKNDNSIITMAIFNKYYTNELNWKVQKAAEYFCG